MNKTFKAVLATALLAVSAGAAKADTTLNGAVGLPLNPTAQIPQEGGIRIQGDYFDMGNVPGVDFKFYGVHAAGRIGDNIELSGGVEKLDVNGIPALDNTGVALGAKYLITRETDPAGVRLAVGVGYSRALLKNYHAYFVASKSLNPLSTGRAPITGHLGIRYDRFSLSDIGGANSKKASIFAGIEVPLSRAGDFQFVGEVASKNNEFAGARIPYSAALRYRPIGQGFSVSVGAQRHAVLTRDTNFFAQIGYSFDTGQ